MGPTSVAPARTALRIRPRARLIGILLAGTCLMWAGAAASHASLVWFGVALLSIAVVAGLWFAVAIALDSRRRVDRILVPQTPQVGRPARVRLEIPGGEPAWSTLTDQAPHALVTGAGERHLDVLPTRRGLLRLGPVRIQREDPFALLRWSRDIGTPTDHLIWPRTDGASAQVLAALEGAVSAFAGIPQPQIDDASVREYHFGDPLERVHWKLSAKHSTLLVRRDEPNRSVHLDLVLAASADEAATDTAVDILAAAASVLIGPGRDVRLITDEVSEPRSLPDALTSLAIARPKLAGPPVVAPRDLIVVALAHDDALVIATWADWLRSRAESAAHARSHDRVIVIPVIPLSPQSENVLAGVTVVYP